MIITMGDESSSQTDLRECGCTSHSTDAIKSIVVLFGLLGIALAVSFR